MNDVVLKMPVWSIHSGYAEPGWRPLCFNSLRYKEKAKLAAN